MDIRRGDKVRNRETGEIAIFVRDLRDFRAVIAHLEDSERQLEVWLDELEPVEPRCAHDFARYGSRGRVEMCVLCSFVRDI